MSKKITLSFTEKEICRIYECLDTLNSIGGTLDDSFNKDCSDGIKTFNKVLKKNGLEIEYDRILNVKIDNIR